MTVFNDNLERDGQIRMCYWISKNMYYLKGLIFFLLEYLNGLL